MPNSNTGCADDKVNIWSAQNIQHNAIMPNKIATNISLAFSIESLSLTFCALAKAINSVLITSSHNSTNDGTSPQLNTWPQPMIAYMAQAAALTIKRYCRKIPDLDL